MSCMFFINRNKFISCGSCEFCPVQTSQLQSTGCIEFMGNQIRGKTELPDLCRAVGVCACAAPCVCVRVHTVCGSVRAARHEKFLASVRGFRRAGVCFGGGAALILRYSRPASSFVSRVQVQCSTTHHTPHTTRTMLHHG